MSDTEQAVRQLFEAVHQEGGKEEAMWEATQEESVDHEWAGQETPITPKDDQANGTQDGKGIAVEAKVKKVGDPSDGNQSTPYPTRDAELVDRDAETSEGIHGELGEAFSDLVQEDKVEGKSGEKEEKLRVDRIARLEQSNAYLLNRMHELERQMLQIQQEKDVGKQVPEGVHEHYRLLAGEIALAGEQAGHALKYGPLDPSQVTLTDAMAMIKQLSEENVWLKSWRPPFDGTEVETGNVNLTLDQMMDRGNPSEQAREWMHPNEKRMTRVVEVREPEDADAHTTVEQDVQRDLDMDRSIDHDDGSIGTVSCDGEDVTEEGACSEEQKEEDQSSLPNEDDRGCSVGAEGHQKTTFRAAPIKCMNNKVSEKTVSYSPRMTTIGSDSIPPQDWMTKAHPLVGSVLTHTVRIEIDGRVVPVTAILDTGGEVTMVRDSVISPDMWKDAWEVKDGLIAGVGTATFDKLLPIKLAMGRTVTQAVWTTILPMPHEQWPFSNADVIVDNMTLQVMLSRIVFSDLHTVEVHTRTAQGIQDAIDKMRDDDVSKSASQAANRDYRLAVMRSA